MQNKKAERRKREIGKALRHLWPDPPVKHLSFRFTGDLHDYDSLRLRLENDFTGEVKTFPVDDISLYLRGNLIQTYYSEGIPVPKRLLGGK